MEKNNLDSTKDLLEVISYVAEMEKQLNRAVGELHSMQQELAAIREKNHPLKNAMQKTIIVMQYQVLNLRDKIAVIKENLIDSCKNTLEAFQQRGISALAGIADFFKVRPALEALREDLDKSIIHDDNAIAKIEAISPEYHKAGLHIKNMGRALVGREALPEAKSPGMVARAFEAPYRAELSCLVAMRNCTNSAIGAVMRLERAERKPPVMETIQKFNAQIAQARQELPAPDRARPIVRDGR